MESEKIQVKKGESKKFKLRKLNRKKISSEERWIQKKFKLRKLNRKKCKSRKLNPKKIQVKKVESKKFKSRKLNLKNSSHEGWI